MTVDMYLLQVAADIIRHLGFYMHSMGVSCASFTQSGYNQVFFFACVKLCKVRGVAHSDQPTKNYHPTLQLLSTL